MSKDEIGFRGAGSVGMDLQSAWALRPGVTYLNHGSFGPSPQPVIDAREAWTRKLEAEPMDFFVRTMEPALDVAAERLAEFVGADANDLLFVPNATVGMNLVANHVGLETGDEVLLTNHEYGAVSRIWREACRRSGAEVRVQRLPRFLDGDGEIVEAFMAGVTDRTRLIVVSHVTSPTAVILPVEAICRAARGRGIPVCIDGPHAPAMVDVDIRTLGCDFYCASLHKWLSAPFGSGFLYVRRERQTRFGPQIISWGGSLGGRNPNWKDEFTWYGTHDPAAFLAVTDALEFFGNGVLDRFRNHARRLVTKTRVSVREVTGREPLVADREERLGSMISLPLGQLDGVEGGHGRMDPLQAYLWETHQIEAPVSHWGGGRLLRVSCHLYNTEGDIDRLASALVDAKADGLLGREGKTE